MINDPALARHRQWLIWTFGRNEFGKKPLKLPKHYDGVTNHNRWNPAPLLSVEEAVAWARYHGAHMGVGFRPVPQTQVACIDIDDCISEAGELTDNANTWVALFTGAAVEKSVSGRGLHIWFSYSCESPGKRPKVVTPWGVVELYADGQFIALGTKLFGSASTDCTPQLQWLVESYLQPRGGPVAACGWDEKSESERAAAVADLRSALAVLEADSYANWADVGIELSSLGDLGFELWNEWSACSPKYDPDACEQKWQTFSADRTDYRAVFKRAEATGLWANPARGRGADPATAGFSIPEGALLEAPAHAEVAGTHLDPSPNGSMMTATVSTVAAYLQGQASKIGLAYDDFRGCVVIGQPGAWREFDDNDYTTLRVLLEQAAFKAVPAEIIKSVVPYLANRRHVDTAIEWAESLRWDGRRRVSNALTRYFGCKPGDYTTAVSEYLFTALAGRCLSPGCQVDMVPILVGGQGLRKTTAVVALCPEASSFVEINLEHKDENLSRSMRGKLVGEIAEMRGLFGRGVESTRAFVTRRIERWVPKYREFGVSFARRLVMIGTANEPELLDDPAGDRRWLPITVGRQCDPEALERDRDQLWAEAIAMWKGGGIRWTGAQEQAKDEVVLFRVVDELGTAIRVWLDIIPPHVPGNPVRTERNGELPFTMFELAKGIGLDAGRLDMKIQRRLGNSLRSLGYSSKIKTIGGKDYRKWIKNSE